MLDLKINKIIVYEKNIYNIHDFSGKPSVASFMLGRLSET